MKVFYCGVQYDKYDQRRGESYEHENFYLSLANYPGIHVRYFPFDDILNKGKAQWNADLLAAAKEEKPDLVLFFMFSDELDKGMLRELKKVATTFAWFSDDHWRFDNYSKYWAPYFTWISTTYSKAVDRYRRIGVKNVVRSQWAANQYVYRPVLFGDPDSPLKIRGGGGVMNQTDSDHNPSPSPLTLKGGSWDVVFVGGWTKPRQKIVSAIERAGIRVFAYGGGWSGGRVNFSEMIKLFSVAKINLGLNPSPGFFNKNSLGRLAFRHSINRIIPDFHLIRNFKTWIHRGIPQIKGRHFEVPACGGFTIAGKADDIENYYAPDKEMVFYDSVPDLIEKIKYYLEHNEEREAIARAGYERTIRDHTYEKRLSEIFRRIGIL